MSGTTDNNASRNNKRKRAPKWPLAARAQCEAAISALCQEGHIREYNPRNEWVIHPSAASSLMPQHQRFLWAKNYDGSYDAIKIRQHAQDPSVKQAITGFEGSNVEILNDLLKTHLRSSNSNKPKEKTPPGGASRTPGHHEGPLASNKDAIKQEVDQLPSRGPTLLGRANSPMEGQGHSTGQTPFS